MAANPCDDITATKPDPDLAEVRYGPHDSNVLDLWQAQADGPRPLVVHIHGGGFRTGSKAALPTSLLNLCLQADISVAAINYRLSGEATFPAAMLDGARAVQFLRSRAEEWNLDPTRVAATGGSAGGGISLWLGFHDDLAAPDSDDPVSRESTRLTCMAVVNTQSSYDLEFIPKLLEPTNCVPDALTAFYGITPDEIHTPEARALYKQASALDLVSAGDPPVLVLCTWPNEPLTTESTESEAIHHPCFACVLKERLDALGIDNELHYAETYPGDDKDTKRPYADPDIVAFFRRQFRM